MKTDRSQHLQFLLLTGLAVAVLLGGCIGKSPPSQFYTLNAIAGPAQGKALPQDISIAIGPVTIPPALDRPQIVTRDMANQVHFSESHRWAGPLDKEIATVLAANLGSLLATERVIPYTSEDILQPTHRIHVSIARFDGSLQNEVLLDATWSIKEANTRQPRLMKKSVIRETVISPDHDGIVAAKNKALAALSEQMAESIRLIVKE